MNRLFFFGFGFVVWLLATILFRIGGHIFFLDDNALILAMLWIFNAIGLMGLSLFLFRQQGLNRAQRYEASAFMIISGMILDAFVTEFFTTVLPNMPASSASSFGAFLLFAYASVLLAAMLPVGDSDMNT